MQIIVIKCPDNNPPVISGLNCETDRDLDNFIIPVCIDEKTCFDICTSDRDKNDSISLTYETNLPGATVSRDTSDPKRPGLRLCWETDHRFMNTGPYVFTVTANDSACPLNGITRRSFQFWVGDTAYYPIQFKMALQDSSCGTYALEAYPPDSVMQQEWEWYLHDTIKIRDSRKASITDSFSYAFDSSGVYPIRVLTRRDGCWHEFYDTLHVNTSSPFTLSTLLDTSLCLKPIDFKFAFKRTFSGSSTNGVTKHEWWVEENSPKNGNKITASFSPINAPQNSTFHYAVEDSAGCRVDKSFNVRIKDRLPVSLLKDTTICDTLHDIPLPFYKGDTSLGYWTSRKGVDGNWLRAGKVGFDRVALHYFHELPEACVVDLAYAEYLKPPLAELGRDDHYSCPNSPMIQLNPQGNGGVLSGDTAAFTTNLAFYPDSLLPDTYQVYYTNTAKNGCVAKDTATFYLLHYLPKVDLGHDRTACLQNDPIDLNASPSGGTLYSGFLNNKQEFLPAKAGLGTHQVYYYVSDSIGCNNFDTANITVLNYQPTANAGNDTTFCEQKAPFLLKNGQPKGGTWQGTYVTHRNDSQFLDTRKVRKNQPFELYYKYADSVGCYAYDTALYEIYRRPNARAGQDILHCFSSADTVTLGGLPAGGSWSGAGLASDNRIPLDSTSFGQFIYTYAFTNNNGCSDQDSLKLTVSPKPVVQVLRADTVCVNGSYSYPLLGTPVGGVWQGPAAYKTGNDSFATRFYDTLPGQFNYFYTYTNSEGCQTTDTTSLSVGAQIQADFTPSSRLGVKPLTVKFTNTSKGANTWLWDFDYSTISSAKSPTFVYLDTGVYVVNLRATDSLDGCVDNAYDTIKVIDSWPVGVEKGSGSTIALFPNPVHNTLTMVNSTQSSWQYALYDVNGKVLLQGQNREGMQQLDVSALAPGVYLFKAQSTSGEHFARWVMVH